MCSDYHQWWWHSIWWRLLIGGGHSRTMCWCRTGSPQRWAMVIGNGISCFLIQWEDAGCSMSCHHGHGLVQWPDQTPYLPSHYHPSSRLCGCERCPLLQHPDSGWGGGFPIAPSDPHSDKRPPCQFHMDLRDLGDAQLRQLIEDFWQEGAQGELNASPIGPSLGCWRTPAWGGDPGVEDKEVTLQGGGMGSQWAATTASGPPYKEDVSHLLSTLVAGLRLGTPRINTFSGNAMPGKTEVSFKQWYHKVQSVNDHYPAFVIQESIVRSLKGAVVDMAWDMGPTTSVTHICHIWYHGIIWCPDAKFPQGYPG